jgi:glycine cleavage system H lipoate-binding protein
MNSAATQRDRAAQAPPATAAVKMVEVFGFKVPTSKYYVHRGHAWAVLEKTGQVRVGMDDFSQKILGPPEAIEFPVVGREYYQDHVCLALVRQGHKAKVLTPVDGIVQEINPKVQEQPALVHDDPYGDGWLFLMQPTNLQRNLDNLYTGEIVASWIDQESHRLLSLLETKAGVTLPSGGTIIDDVYGHFPDLGWRKLVQEFFLKDLTRTWKKRY